MEKSQDYVPGEYHFRTPQEEVVSFKFVAKNGRLLSVKGYWNDEFCSFPAPEEPIIE